MFTQLLELATAPHGVDRFLELVRPTWAADDTRARVVAVDRETPDVVTLTLRPGRGWERGEAGQHVRLGVEIDGRRHTRCFSLSSSAGRTDGLVQVTVKAQVDGVVSRHLVDHARPGTVVALGAPEGDFTLPARRPERLVLISGGSGITPVMAILRTLLDEGATTPVTFLHYARTAADVIYAVELAHLGATHDHLDVHVVLTSEAGRFGADHVEALVPDLAAAETYACGPVGLVDSVIAHWDAAGATERLHVERFALATVPPVAGEGGGADPLRRQRRHRRRRRPHAPGAGRGRRADARLRVPDGHLPHLHPHQDRRPGPRRPQRRPLGHRRGAHPALRVGALLRRRRRPLIPIASPKESPMTATLTAAPDVDDVDVDLDLDALGAQLDAIRDAVIADLGQRDADHIRGVVKLQRGLEVSGRILLMAGVLPPAWLGGVAALSVAKILDNMEIGHNVMHGQYDWMQDPALDSATFEWDTACPADQWRHSHNYVHHTFTNVLGKDRDVGYGILRMTDEQRWHPRDLGNPVYALALAALFQWGVALHDVELDRVMAGKKTKAEAQELLDGVWAKARTQVLKDYALYPALAGPMAPVVASGNLAANLVRNLWTFTIIFCGHFPDGVQTFTQEEADGEGRGGWYRRQLLGSANISGSRGST